MPIGAEPVPFAGLFDDLDNLRMVRQAVEIGMIVNLAPTAGEGDLIVGRQVLIAKTEYGMIQKRTVNGIELAIAQVAKIDPADPAPIVPESGVILRVISANLYRTWPLYCAVRLQVGDLLVAQSQPVA